MPSKIADTGNEIANTISSNPGPAKDVRVDGITEKKMKIIVKPL